MRPTLALALAALSGLAARSAFAADPPAPPVAPPVSLATLPPTPPPTQSAETRQANGQTAGGSGNAKLPAHGTAIRFDPETPDLWLLGSVGDVNDYVEDYGDSFRRGHSYYHATGHYFALCKGPCATRISKNGGPMYVLKGRREPLPVEEVKVTGPSVLHATYVDRRNQRYLGLAIAVVGVGVGSAMMIEGTTGSSNPAALIGTGGAVALVGLAVGAYFGFREDEAHIEVLPLEAPHASPSVAPSAAIAPVRAAEGAMLRVRF
jgi:hypothetical protein